MYIVILLISIIISKDMMFI